MENLVITEFFTAVAVLLFSSQLTVAPSASITALMGTMVCASLKYGSESKTTFLLSTYTDIARPSSADTDIQETNAINIDNIKYIFLPIALSPTAQPLKQDVGRNSFVHIESV